MKSILLATILCVFGLMGCEEPQSASGVKKANVAVETGADGLTVEQRNVAERYKLDNKPGSIKHLYVISAYSGQVLFYSTVKGKVTSSGKRLTPSVGASQSGSFLIRLPNGHVIYTNEILGDDGTYGSSVEYLYWFDARGIYHQHYVNGGQILHISDQPIRVKGVIINLESNSQE